MRRATLDDVDDINLWNERDIGEPVDFSDFIANDLNVCLLEGEGGAFFMWRGPGVYECHCFFEQRGKEVIRLSLEMLDTMKREHGARMFWSMVPVENRKTRLHCRWIGWKSLGVKDLPEPYGTSEIFASEYDICLQS